MMLAVGPTSGKSMLAWTGTDTLCRFRICDSCRYAIFIKIYQSMKL